MPSDSTQPIDNPSVASTSACRHLLSKGMYVTGLINPEDEHDQIGDGHCWCGQTQNVLGPDDQFVERRLCIAGRKCFEARA